MNKWLDSTVRAYTDNFGLTANPVVYEVGSRDGNDGVELAKRIYQPVYHKNFWHDSCVVLFECNPIQLDSIRSRYPHATLITEAISDKKGTVEFLQLHGDKNVMGSSTMDLNRSKVSWAQNNTTIKVDTVRLDEVIKRLEHQDREIDIMKIDIEGFSFEALKSLGKYLRNVKVFHIETEIEGHARAETNIDIALFMDKNGFTCTAIEYEYPPNIEDHVYVRREKN